MSTLRITVDDKTYDVVVRPDPADPEHFTAEVDGKSLEVIAPYGDDQNLLEWALIGNRPYELVLDKDLDWIQTWSGRHRLYIRDLEAAFARPVGGDGRVKAPIPGLIVRVLVEEGATVEAGQALLVLEAMKMENEIRATRAGVVSSLRSQPGQTVTMGEVLVEIG